MLPPSLVQCKSQTQSLAISCHISFITAYDQGEFGGKGSKLHEHKTGCSLGGCSQHHRALSAMEVVKAMVQTNMSISIVTC